MLFLPLLALQVLLHRRLVKGGRLPFLDVNRPGRAFRQAPSPSQ
jgi:hypothetical protein